MRVLAYILIILFSTSAYSQNISNLYQKHEDAVVLIITSKPEIIDQVHPKILVNVNGIGTGFVISKEGEILTAAHVVQTANYIIVKFSDGEEIPAKVLYSFPTADVALLKLNIAKSTPLKTVKLSNSDNVKIGDQIFIIGSPFGLGHSLSVGYVSGKHSKKNIANNFITTQFIKTDAAINKGSSGSPMFNMQGEVIGIASFILSNSQGFQGVGFAATSNIAKKLLCEEKSVWTGIDSYLITGSLAQILNLPQKSGLLITKVADFSLGNALKLKGGQYILNIEGEELIVGGDIILSIENIPLINEDNLFKSWLLIQKLKSGDSLKIKILRSGKLIELQNVFP